MLIVPIRTSKNDMVGVLELINRLDGRGTHPVHADQRFYITQFAFYAGIAIERALLLRDVVFKMVKTTELRDPEETQPHVAGWAPTRWSSTRSGRRSTRCRGKR